MSWRFEAMSKGEMIHVSKGVHVNRAFGSHCHHFYFAWLVVAGRAKGERVSQSDEMPKQLETDGNRLSSISRHAPIVSSRLCGQCAISRHDAGLGLGCLHASLHRA